MTLKLGNIFLITVMLLAMLMGCDKAREMIGDTTPEATAIDDTMSEMAMETSPVKLVLLIDYPEGGKDAYLAQVASIAETLQAPEEIVRIRSYDNQDPEMSPHRFVEFNFQSFLDAAIYLNRPEIAAAFADLPNHATQVTTYTFIQAFDYTHAKEQEEDWQIKHVYLIDFSLGGKQAYLEYAQDVATVLLSPTQIRAVSSYDNYYGGSPHRLVEFEFATQEDAVAYHALEEVIQIAEAELESQAGNWSQVLHKFELRSDYINDSMIQPITAPATSWEGPEAFTVSFVQAAIDLYKTEGLEATITHYNDPASMDGQWYVFIADENDLTVAHAPKPNLLGTDIKENTGPNGFRAGIELAKATEVGLWVEYHYENPINGEVELKRTWAIRYDGYLFASGYYTPDN